MRVLVGFVQVVRPSQSSDWPQARAVEAANRSAATALAGTVEYRGSRWVEWRRGPCVRGADVGGGGWNGQRRAESGGCAGEARHGGGGRWGSRGVDVDDVHSGHGM